MTKGQRWETRPLESWAKAKDMRARFEKAVRTAGQEKVLLAQGGTTSIWAFAFPAIRLVEDNPLGAMMAFQSDKFSRECRLACEIRGWGREICGYQLNCWGAQYLDRQIDGSKFPLRDMVIPMPHPCDSHTKRGQLPMDYSNIPRWQSDTPVHTDEPDPVREQEMIENKVGCILDEIQDVERITGQKFDDEKFKEALINQWKYREYAGEVCCMIQHVPAPLGQKELYSFYTLGSLTKTDPAETVELWKMLRDEVKWRTENNIAAVGTERYRWIEHHPPPWHFLKYYRYMEQYGAVCIGSLYSHMMGIPYEINEKGEYVSAKTPLQLGVPLETREQCVRALVGTIMGGTGQQWDDLLGWHQIRNMAKYFKVDGAVLALWRSGIGCTYLRKKCGLVLSEMGIRVMHYEGSQPGDRTDMDENRMLDQLDVWMETQGLRKLEE